MIFVIYLIFLDFTVMYTLLISSTSYLEGNIPIIFKKLHLIVYIDFYLWRKLFEAD